MENHVNHIKNGLNIAITCIKVYGFRSKRTARCSHRTTPRPPLHHSDRGPSPPEAIRRRQASKGLGSGGFIVFFHGFPWFFLRFRGASGAFRPRTASKRVDTRPKALPSGPSAREPPCRDDLGWLEVRGGLRSHEVAHDRRLDAHVRQQVPRLERPVLGPKWLEKHGFSHFSALKISKNIKNTSEK